MSVFSTVKDLVSNKDKRDLMDIPLREEIQLYSDININLSPPVTPGELFRETRQRHLLNRTKSCLRCESLKCPVMYLHIPNSTSPSAGYSVLCPSFVYNSILNYNFGDGRHFRKALQMFFLPWSCWDRLGIFSHMSSSIIHRLSHQKVLLN